MHPAPATVLVLLLASACQSAQPACEESVSGGLLVRVVDGAGEPVRGAEVRAQGAVRRSPLVLLDELLAGSVRRADEYGLCWRTDERGAVRIPAGLLYRHVIARDGDRFGAVHIGSMQPDELAIVLERDESVRARCVDAEGRPAVGALVGVGVSPPAEAEGERHGEWWWAARMTAADGTLEIPHAQLWRGLQREGWKVTVAGFVWWGAEMGPESAVPFPALGGEPLAFTVSPHGYLDVLPPTATVPADSEVWLRWLNAPPDPDDPDDVPEVSFGVTEGWNLAVPLGARFEAVLEVPAFLDTRVAFDGPRRPGERVEVALGPLRPAARVTGRLVDDAGNPMPRRGIDAWLERAGERVEPEEDWLVTDDEGRFAFDFAPGRAGTLRIRVDPIPPDFPLPERFVLGGAPRELPPPIAARHEFTVPLSAGEVPVGDLVCRAGR